jgi:hypothetical protein
MKLNTSRLLEQCIDEGIKHALNNTDLSEDRTESLADVISREIWIQLDYYFDFE